jgi:hypothetical protein
VLTLVGGQIKTRLGLKSMEESTHLKTGLDEALELRGARDFPHSRG